MPHMYTYIYVRFESLTFRVIDGDPYEFWATDWVTGREKGETQCVLDPASLMIRVVPLRMM